jgi:hypothetical protein
VFLLASGLRKANCFREFFNVLNYRCPVRTNACRLRPVQFSTKIIGLALGSAASASEPHVRAVTD